jgi:hypothetical protein
MNFLNTLTIALTSPRLLLRGTRTPVAASSASLTLVPNATEAVTKWCEPDSSTCLCTLPVSPPWRCASKVCHLRTHDPYPAPLLLISPALSTSASIGPGLVAGTQLPSYAPVLSKLHLYSIIMFWKIRVFGAPGSGLGFANELRVELRAISENSPAMMCSWWSQWVVLESGVCRVSHLEGSCELAAMLFREACCC